MGAPTNAPTRLVLPLATTSAAPWAEAIPERALTLDDLGASAFFLGVSDDFAAVWTRVGVFLVEHERGVVDRLELPKGADWVGFDERGVLAGGGGGLRRAADPRADWTRLATLEDADQFDASVGTIVASEGAALWVSTDGGATFATRETPLTRIENLLTRPDGAIVLQGADEHGGSEAASRRSSDSAESGGAGGSSPGGSRWRRQPASCSRGVTAIPRPSDSLRTRGSKRPPGAGANKWRAGPTRGFLHRRRA